MTIVFLLLAVTAVSSQFNNNNNGIGSYFRQRRPNILFILADDVGYGDLSISGHPTVKTDNLDWLAENGRYFTRFYVTNPICSPSRASILTSKYPVRTGVYGVFWPFHTLGLPQDETTLATVLKNLGYSTHITGKWHLGIGKDWEYLPYSFGFDDGVVMTVANSACDCQKTPCFPDPDPAKAECAVCASGPILNIGTSCPLVNRTHVVQQPAKLIETSDIFIEDALQYLEQVRQDNIWKPKYFKDPFFLFLPLIQGHIPYYNNERYYNVSKRGTYGDQMLEMDGIVGEMLDYLKQYNMLDDTIVVFTSDNGPTEERRGEFGGSSLLYRCGKLSTAEGGLRVPGIVYWKDNIVPGKSNEMVSSMDIFPTLLSLIGEEDSIPDDIDGVDQSRLFLDPTETSARDILFGYSHAITEGADPFVGFYREYKAHYYQRGPTRPPFLDFPPRVSEFTDDLCRDNLPLTEFDPPRIYNLDRDPEEKYDLTLIEPDNTEIVDIMNSIREDHLQNTVWMPNRVVEQDLDAQVCCTGDIQACRDTGNFPDCCDCPNN